MVMDNQAGNSGGAVWASDGSEVVATGNTTFIGNACQNYGGESFFVTIFVFPGGHLLARCVQRSVCACF